MWSEAKTTYSNCDCKMIAGIKHERQNLRIMTSVEGMREISAKPHMKE